VRLSELKKCVEKIPPVNDYVSEISLERDQERYVVFAAPVVLKRIVCGSCKIGTCAYPRRWFAGWLGVNSGQIRKVPKAFELRLEVSKKIVPASLARQKPILANIRYRVGHPLPRNGYPPVMFCAVQRVAKSKNEEPSTAIVGTSIFLSKNRFRISQLFSAISRQPWQGRTGPRFP
jgi:hypothetical protein